MAYDALLDLQAEVTKTASFSPSSGVDLGGLPKDTPMYARVKYGSATNASGSNALTWSIEHSDNSNSAFTAHTSGAADVVNLSTTAQAGLVYIPVVTTKRYIRLVLTVSGGGSTPSVVYSAKLGLTKP